MYSSSWEEDIFSGFKKIIKQGTGVNKLEKCFFNLFPYKCILIVCRIFLASWRLVET